MFVWVAETPAQVPFSKMLLHVAAGILVHSLHPGRRLQFDCCKRVFSGVQLALLWDEGSQLLLRPNSRSSPRSSFWEKSSQNRQQCCCRALVQMTDRSKETPPSCVAEMLTRQDCDWVCASDLGHHLFVKRLNSFCSSTDP